MIFGQTDAANLDEADNNQIKNAKAKVFVADSVDWNSKNRNKYRNDAQKRRKERKEWTIINNIDKRNDDDGYNDEAENGKAKDLSNLDANANRRDDNERLNDD